MRCEVLVGAPLNRRGRGILTAMVDSGKDAGVTVIPSTQYQGSSDYLMAYGLGSPHRRQWIDKHRDSGGTVIGWDMGYWDREEMMRLTIGEDHCTRMIRDMPPERWDVRRVPLRSDYRKDGHILLVGMGEKSRQLLGYQGQSWELDMLRQINLAYPGRIIVYKYKKPERFVIPGFDGPIEDALSGCALVVCRHSNVAIDACIAGVPVVCFDGAGSSLYGSDLSNPVNPSEQERIRFLRNLAWWQWKPSEAVQAWKFIRETVCA